MPVVASVTKVDGDTLTVSQDTSNIGGNTGGVAFVLRGPSGQRLGSYRSVGAAQAAFGLSHGTSRILKWNRSDLAGDIEQHVAIGLPLDPKDIWGPNLAVWWEPAAVPGSVIQSDVVTADIQIVNDISGSGNQVSQAVSVKKFGAGLQPNLIDSDPAFGERITINFDGPGNVSTVETMSTTDPPPTPITVPFVLMVVASYTGPSGDDRDLIKIAGFELGIEAGVTSPWEVRNPAKLTGSASTGGAELITVVQTATGGELIIGGSSVSNVSVPGVVGAVEFSGNSALETWVGHVAMVMLALGEDPSGTKRAQTTRYVTEKFL